jgi:hypothetical protein
VTGGGDDVGGANSLHEDGKGSPVDQDSDFTLFYMCEPGRLEWQSLCLASSIMAFCSDRYRMTAYCSRHKVSMLRQETIHFHAKHGIPIALIDTERVFDRPYDIGGKIVAAATRRSGTYGVLMDTDTMMVNTVNFSGISSIHSVSAFPSHTNLLEFAFEDWRYAYGKFGLQPTSRRFRSDPQVDKPFQLSFPYFNAGVIIFPQKEFGKPFGQHWLETTLSLQSDDRIPSRRPWLDQIALPISIARADLGILPLDRIYNFPVEERGKAIRPDAKIIHYHLGENLRHSSICDLAGLLVKEFTDFAGLAELFEAYAMAGYSGRR